MIVPSTSADPTQSSSPPPVPSTPRPRMTSNSPPLPSSSSNSNSNPAALPSSSTVTSTPVSTSNSTHALHNHTQATSSSSSRQPCAKCGQSMTGQFVRALGTVYHLDCFRCQDCGKVVANKFFPVDSSSDGRSQYPLCETDYFRRLGLICAKCGGALRGSYITALDMKFHVEHFTCSVCPTVFGPQDSYYEHSGQVYCHFHYSTRFAVKCTGCRTAILKQFVEINRNNTDEHWHPECYMINKFWNIKLAVSPPPRKSVLPAEPEPLTENTNPSENSPSLESLPTNISQQALTQSKSPNQPPSTREPSPDWKHQEAIESAQSLREKQKMMEEQVYRIWTVLSTFEESSAACISEMLRHVSSGHYLEGVRMAGKFVLHVETLFAAIDDLDSLFRNKNAKEISHVREARMLCKKIVNFFSLLSHTHETGARKMSITQELLSLVTGLAHYLKILIRIALTSALKLERDYLDRVGILQFLSRLDRLAREPDASKPTAATSPSNPSHQTSTSGSISFAPSSLVANGSTSALTQSQPNSKPRAYGYKSLTRAVGTLFGQGEATTDLCEGCKQTVEEECVRFGTSLRWHTSCLKCSKCHRSPVKTSEKQSSNQIAPSTESHQPPSSPPPLTRGFKMDMSLLNRENGGRSKNLVAYCDECATQILGENRGALVINGGSHQPSLHLKEGFESVTRLEQYAFLLCVALNKLYGLLKQRGVLPASAQESRAGQVNEDERSLYDAYRNSSDIKRMKSVDLDRKLSTTARIPQRSTVVESPSGRVAQAAVEPQHQNGAGAGNPISAPLRPQDPSRNPPNSRPPAVSPLRPQVLDRNNRVNRERDYTNLPRSEPPPRPPPTHLNMIPQNSNNHMTNGTASNSTSSGMGTESNYHQQQTAHVQNQQSEHRPALSRNLTAVKIVDEQPGPNEWMVRDEPRLGSTTGPMNGDSAGITLADLPRAMEAEQFREQHKPLPTQVMTLSELSALESIILKHVVALTLSSDSSHIKEFTSLDELLEIIEVRKEKFWGKLFKGSTDKSKIKKKGVFGIPLDVLIERQGVDSLLGAGAGQLRIPSFIDECISAMKQMDMSIEGVFRKNGNIRRLKELADLINEGSSQINLGDDNPVQLAALLKKFLRDLPDPLLTFKLYHIFIASQRIDNDDARRKTLHLICCLLPKAHRDTMEVLFVFMKWVASFSHVDEETGSKMDLQNLATVITPNILYSRSKDPTRDESFLAIRAVHELLENQDELFQVPAEVQMIIHDPELLNANLNEITSKDILRRVEALLKSNQGKMRFGTKGGNEYDRARGEIHPPRRPDLHGAASFTYEGARPMMEPVRTGGSIPNNATLTPNLQTNGTSTFQLNGYPRPTTPQTANELVYYPSHSSPSTPTGTAHRPIEYPSRVSSHPNHQQLIGPPSSHSNSYDDRSMNHSHHSHDDSNGIQQRMIVDQRSAG